MKKIYVLLLLSVALCISCSETEDLMSESVANESEHMLTPQDASNNVLDFVSKMNVNSRSSVPVSISDVEAFTLPSELASRASAGCPDTLFYVVNFSDNKGFALAGADDRDPKVYAIVEDGTFSYNDSTATGFNIFLSNLIGMKLRGTMSELPPDTDEDPDRGPDDPDDGSGGGGNGSGSNEDYFHVMSPLLVTKWGQEEPYNTFCPSGCDTGCVPTAIAQICSYLEAPTIISYNDNGVEGSTNLDWESINAECCTLGLGILFSDNSKRQVGMLMRYLGVLFDAEYTSGEPTKVDSEYAIAQMQRMRPSLVTDLVDYDVDNVIRDLNSGNKIVYMRGNARYYHIWLVIRKYVDGHGWVVDGYISQRQNGEVTKYLHCNWGWGGVDSKNGYFLSDVLNSDEEPVYDDYVTSRSGNYRYRLKTSTFTK